MCGIVAVFNSSYEKDFIVDRLNKKLDSIVHRGPDGRHIVAGDGWGVGHVRLAINDRSSGGDQPFVHNDLVLACNGEIYNHEILRTQIEGYPYRGTSDNEVILPLYERLGSACAEQLDGEFAFVIYDKEKKTVFAAKDPIGVKPLFYCENEDGEIWFASERHALGDMGGTIYPVTQGCYWEQKRTVRYFKPAWWNFCGPVSVPDGAVDYDMLREKLVNAVRKRLMSDVPVGCMLSGGLDSSIVTAIAAKFYPGELNTFTVGFSSAEESVDLHYARQVAKYLGTKHHEIIVSEDEVVSAAQDLYELGVSPSNVLGFVPQYLLYRYSRDFVKVLLIGEGADEIFNGYANLSHSRPDIQTMLCRTLLILSTGLLLRADHSSMRAGVEARVPFLDKDFLSYVMQLDPLLKSCGDFRPEKYMLRKAFQGWLPDEILWRTKLTANRGYSSNYMNIYSQVMGSLSPHLVRTPAPLFAGGAGEPDVHPMEVIYNQYDGDHVFYPKWFFGEFPFADVAMDPAASKEVLVEPDDNSRPLILEFLLKFCDRQEQITLTDSLSRILSSHGLRLISGSGKQTYSIGEALASIKLIVTKIALSPLSSNKFKIKSAVG